MMQTVQQPGPSIGARIWRAIVKLDFISAFFTWAMEALARITEPLASLSAIYIIIVAGVPVVLNDHLYTLALALIIGSPELLVVGAFKIASRELAAGNKKAWWLMLSCFTLLLLTALTVGDLFMWHWHQDAVSILMGCRCLAGIAYTFTRGIVTDQKSELDVSPGSPVNLFLDRFTQSIQETVNLAQQHLLAEVHRMNQATLTEVHSLVQEVNQQYQHLLAEVNRVNPGVQADLQTAVATLGQQHQQALDAAVEHLERTYSRRIEAVYTRLEQVRVTMESNPSLPAMPAPHRSQFRQLPRTTQSVHSQGEPQTDREVHRTPVNLVPVNPGEVNGDDGEGSKVNAGKTFTVNHLQANGVLPTLAMIQAAVVCSKTLASRIRGQVAAELSLKESGE